MAAQELRWLTYLLTDLGEQPRSPPVLYVDNKAILALYREHRLEHRTKHIALRYFLTRELQQRGQLRLAYVASEANTADIFTKALAPGDHQRFCTMLGRAGRAGRDAWGDQACSPPPTHAFPSLPSLYPLSPSLSPHPPQACRDASVQAWAIRRALHHPPNHVPSLVLTTASLLCPPSPIPPSPIPPSFPLLPPFTPPPPPPHPPSPPPPFPLCVPIPLFPSLPTFPLSPPPFPPLSPMSLPFLPFRTHPPPDVRTRGAYDQHLNMILGEAEEVVTTVEIDDETYEEIVKAPQRAEEVVTTVEIDDETYEEIVKVGGKGRVEEGGGGDEESEDSFEDPHSRRFRV
ncbi:unnamed protein product [Closterium sp. NIES-54]